MAVTDAAVRDEAGALLADELDAIDHACSRFRDDSELARAERRRPGAWRHGLAALPRRARRGPRPRRARPTVLVDPTIGRALRVLGYDRDFASVAADGAPLRVRVERTAGLAVRSRSTTPRAGFAFPRGVELDLGATAKAFAADRAARAHRGRDRVRA